MLCNVLLSLLTLLLILRNDERCGRRSLNHCYCGTVSFVFLPFRLQVKLCIFAVSSCAMSPKQTTRRDFAARLFIRDASEDM